MRTINRSWQSLVNFPTPQIISKHRGGGNPMKEPSKTKQVLIQELAFLKQRIAELVQAIMVTFRPDVLEIKPGVYLLNFM